MLFFIVSAIIALAECQMRIRTLNVNVTDVQNLYYDNRSEDLYFANPIDGVVFRYDFNTKKIENIEFPRAMFVKTSKVHPYRLYVGASKSVYTLVWQKNSANYTKLALVSELGSKFIQPKEILAAAVADEEGNLIVSTFSNPPPIAQTEDGAYLSANRAYLYEIFENGMVTRDIFFAPYAIAGLAWSPDLLYLYYSASLEKVIIRLKIDSDINETFSVLLKDALADYEGYPGGITTDNNGLLWIPMVGGAVVLQADPVSENIKRVLHFEQPYVTSACFGGPRLATMFVSTTSVPLFKSQQPSNTTQPIGTVYAVTGIRTSGFVPPMPSIKYRQHGWIAGS